MGIKITPIKISEVELYKQIRLEALKTAPFAFDTSFEEAVAWEDLQWKEELEKCVNPKDSISVFAKDGEEVVGYVHVFFNPKKKKRHIADFDTLYVSESHRGKGLATMLINYIVEELKSKYPHVVKLSLSVYEEQASAIALYKRLGFVECGKFEKGLQVDGRFFSQFAMDLFIWET